MEQAKRFSCEAIGSAPCQHLQNRPLDHMDTLHTNRKRLVACSTMKRDLAGTATSTVPIEIKTMRQNHRTATTMGLYRGEMNTGG